MKNINFTSKNKVPYNTFIYFRLTICFTNVIDVQKFQYVMNFLHVLKLKLHWAIGLIIEIYEM